MAQPKEGEAKERGERLDREGGLSERKGEPEKAEEYFNRAIKSMPDMEEPYLLFADMQAARGAPDKAIEVLDRGEGLLGKREADTAEKGADSPRACGTSDALERALSEVVKINDSSLEAAAV